MAETPASGGETRFALARMSTGIRTTTIGLLTLPIVFLVLAATRTPPLAIPGILLVAIYIWIWLRFRPTRFVVHSDALEIIWPCKHVLIPRARIRQVRLMDREAVRREAGWRLRIGAGGLWGGFGWLWTSRRGFVRLYVSRTTDLVWIEQAAGPPWLITPDMPQAFVRAVVGASR